MRMCEKCGNLRGGGRLSKLFLPVILCLAAASLQAADVTTDLTISAANQGTYNGQTTNFIGSAATPITITINGRWDTTNNTTLNFGPYTTLTGATNVSSIANSSGNTYFSFNDSTIHTTVTIVDPTDHTFLFYSGNRMHYTIQGNTGLTVNVDSGVTTQFSGVFANASGQTGKLVKTGDGQLNLSASNSYTGVTTLKGGTLVIGTAATPPATSGYTGGFAITQGSLVNNTTSNLNVSFNSGGKAVTLRSNLGTNIGKFTTKTDIVASAFTLVNATLTINTKGRYIGAGTTYFNNATIDIQETTGQGGWPGPTLFSYSSGNNNYYIGPEGLTMNVAADKQAEISGKLQTRSAGPDGDLTKTGPGLLAIGISSENTFTGSTVVNEGTLLVRSGASLPGGVTPNNGMIQNNSATALALKSSTNEDAEQSIELAGKFNIASDAEIIHAGNWTLGKGTNILPANSTAQTPAAIGTQTPSVVTMTGANSKLTANILTVKDGSSYTQGNGTTTVGVANTNTFLRVEGSGSALNVDGGTLNVNGWCNVDWQPYQAARNNSLVVDKGAKMNVTDGTVNVAGCFRVGESSGTNELTVSGGTINVGTNSSSINRALFIGGGNAQTGGTGKLTMTGGAINTLIFGVGHNTAGFATISGGEVNVNKLALYGGSDSSTITISDAKIHTNYLGFDTQFVGRGTLTLAGSNIEWKNQAGTSDTLETFLVTPYGKAKFIVDEGGFSTVNAGTVTLASNDTNSSKLSVSTSVAMTTLDDLQTLLGDTGICLAQATTNYTYGSTDVSTGYLKLKSDTAQKALYAVLNEEVEKAATVTSDGIEFNASEVGFVQLPHEMADISLAIETGDQAAFAAWFNDCLPGGASAEYDTSTNLFKLTGMDSASGFAWDFSGYGSAAALSGIYGAMTPVSGVPEPAAWILMAFGALGLCWLRKK